MSERGTVLIVDDNPQNVQLLAQILQDENFGIIIALSGSEALQYLAKEQPDLILLDIMMPQMNGFEVCKKIKDSPKIRNIPVIFLTALHELSDKLNAFENGAVDYITKPFLREEVVARVMVHVQLRRTILKLKRMAVTDELTGLFNRRFCFDVFKRQLALANRYKRSLVIYYVDINNLKKINDTYGHDEGDNVIRRVATELRKNIRVSDFIFRLGGDEFLLLFPETDLESTNNLMNRVKTILNRQKIQDVVVDFSFGYTEYKPGDKTTIRELIQKADNAMYENKPKQD